MGSGTSKKIVFHISVQAMYRLTNNLIISMYIHHELLPYCDSIGEISYIIPSHSTLCGGFIVILPTHTHNIRKRGKD